MERAAPWHPFRLPGLCGLRGMLASLGLISGIIVFTIWCLDSTKSFRGEGGNATITASGTPVPAHPAGAPAFPLRTTPYTTPHINLSVGQPGRADRHKRWATTDMPTHSLKTPAHAYATNLWWRYVNSAARAQGHVNCFFCSRMPRSTVQPSFGASALGRRTTLCMH